MIQSISERKADFMGQALERNRLVYTTQRGAYTLFANVGFIGDNLLGLQGTLSGTDHDPHNPMNGPIGFSTGFVFASLGLLVGHVVNLLIECPAWLGYGLDWATGLDRIAAARGKEYSSLPDIVRVPVIGHSIMLLNLCHTIMSAFCYRPPENMDGAFGMLFGVIPELIRFATILTVAYLVATVDYCFDLLCLGINISKNAAFGQEEPKPTDSSHPEAGAMPPPPPGTESDDYSEYPAVNEAIKNKADLYYTLFEERFEDASDKDYSEAKIKKAFQTRYLRNHPDKNQNGDPEVTQNLTIARDVILDPTQRAEYNEIAEAVIKFTYPETPSI